jgi:hypothetical protein
MTNSSKYSVLHKCSLVFCFNKLNVIIQDYQTVIKDVENEISNGSKEETIVFKLFRLIVGFFIYQLSSLESCVGR